MNNADVTRLLKDVDDKEVKARIRHHVWNCARCKARVEALKPRKKRK